MALAQLWCVSLGCQAEAEFEATCLQHEPGASLPERHIARQRRKRAVGQLPPRRLSCVVRGRLVLLALQYQSEPFPVGILRAGPWPQTITAPQKQLKPSAVNKKKRNVENDKNAARGNTPAPRGKKSILVSPHPMGRDTSGPYGHSVQKSFAHPNSLIRYALIHLCAILAKM